MTLNKFLTFALSFIILLFCYPSLAQENEAIEFQSQTHFITGIGGSYVNVIDEGISPLLYKGIGGSVILGHYHEKKNIVNTSSTKFDFNNPSSSISNAEMYTFRLEGHYQQYWKFTSQKVKEWKIRPGFQVSAKWALRQHLSFTNNSQHIETRFSISPALMVARPLHLWNRNFELGIFTNTPLVTYATRPLFASTKFSSSINKEVEVLDYVKDGKIVSFGNYFKWSAQSYIYYSLENGNGLRLDYFWDYENYKSQNPIRTGEHSIMISTFFKI